MTDAVGGLAGLAKLGRPAPTETELDRFAAYVASGAIITHATAFDVCAERGDSERSYKPDGGLTEAVYRLAGNDDERAILARGILEGELVRRGHEYRAIRVILDQYECDDLRDLVEGHSFGAVAEALAEVIPAPAAESRRGRSAQFVPEAGQKIGEEAGIAPAHGETVAAFSDDSLLWRRLPAGPPSPRRRGRRWPGASPGSPTPSPRRHPASWIPFTSPAGSAARRPGSPTRPATATSPGGAS